jgi:hypothetical protein
MTGSTIIFAIVMLHLLAGFGYVIYKLSPRKGEREERKEV